MTTSLLLLWLATPGQACTWWWWFGGWDPGVDDAVDVPVDAEIVARINATQLRFEVLPVGGDTPVDGAVGWWLGNGQVTDRVSFLPDAPLEPDTTYDVDVFVVGYEVDYDPDVPVQSMQFTTGSGASPTPVAPTVTASEATAWAEDTGGRWYCSLGNPVSFRTLTLEVDLPEAPSWSWVVVRGADAGKEDVQHIEPLTASGSRTLVFDQTDFYPSDCFTVAVRHPDGSEASSEESCPEAPDPGDDPGEERGCGCDAASGSGGAGAAILALVGLARRRRARQALCPEGTWRTTSW